MSISIPTAFEMKEATLKSINSFDDNLYSEITENLAWKMKKIAEEGKASCRYILDDRNVPARRNVLMKLKEDLISRGYTVLYTSSHVNCQGTAHRLEINWE